MFRVLLAALVATLTLSACSAPGSSEKKETPRNTILRDGGYRLRPAEVHGILKNAEAILTVEHEPARLPDPQHTYFNPRGEACFKPVAFPRRLTPPDQDTASPASVAGCFDIYMSPEGKVSFVDALDRIVFYIPARR